MTAVRRLPVGGGTMTDFGSRALVPDPSADGLRLGGGGTCTVGGVLAWGSPPTVGHGSEIRGVTYSPPRGDEERSAALGYRGPCSPAHP